MSGPSREQPPRARANIRMRTDQHAAATESSRNLSSRRARVGAPNGISSMIVCMRIAICDGGEPKR